MAAVRSAGEARGAVDERTAAEALGPPVGERPADLLLERQEEARAGDEDEGPERVERGVGLVRERLVRHDQEHVRGEGGDHEAAADRERPLGDGVPRLARSAVSARSFTRGNPGIVGRDERCTDHPKAA